MTETFSKSRQAAETEFSRIKADRSAPAEHVNSAEDMSRAKTARLREARLAEAGRNQQGASYLLR